MQIKNIVIFDSQTAADGQWIDISNLVAMSVQVTGLEGNVWIEVSNDPYVQINGANALAAPAAPTLSQFAYGAMKNQGTYFVKTTYITKFGETLPSAEASLAVLDGNILQVASPVQDAAKLAIGYNVYVGSAAGTEVLQTMPAYTPAWKMDLLPGIKFATNGAIPIGQPFRLQNGLMSTGINPPVASTSGGPNVGLNLTGNLAGVIAASEEIAIFQDSGKTMAMVNPSCLCWKWIRVRKDASAQTKETIAYLMGQNG